VDVWVWCRAKTVNFFLLTPPKLRPNLVYSLLLSLVITCSSSSCSIEMKWRFFFFWSFSFSKTIQSALRVRRPCPTHQMYSFFFTCLEIIILFFSVWSGWQILDSARPQPEWCTDAASLLRGACWTSPLASAANHWHLCLGVDVVR